MKKRKTPVLTSPWKIGFLVSLLLISTAIGSNYILTRVFSISWGWLAFEQGNWAFDMNLFTVQMFPQIALVALLSLISYFAVASAVRKYKNYLDSGLDYKNLVLSIKNIDDLNNDEKLKKLDSYPELKHFVDIVRDHITEENMVLEERRSDYDLLLAEREESLKLETECKLLTGVIRKSAKAGKKFGIELELSHPKAKEILDAIRGIPGRGGHKWGDEDRTKMEELCMELRQAGDYLKGKLEEISAELLQDGEIAKEIETQLDALKNKIRPGSEEPEARWDIKALRKAGGLLSTMDKLSDSLSELSEEAKSVAISTALQAGSGESTLADLIQLAEGVKDIADKFDRSAGSYIKLGEQIKKELSVVEKQAEKLSSDINSEVAASINAIAGKTSLWVERIVVLADKLKTLEKSYNLSFKTLEDKIGGYAASKDAEDVQVIITDEKDQSDDPVQTDPEAEFGFEKQEPVSPLFGYSDEGLSPDLVPETVSDSSKTDDIPDSIAYEKEESNISSHIAAEPSSDDEQKEELQGLELDQNTIFKQDSTRKNDYFAELQPENDEEKGQSEDVIDLYALGAVDYVPEISGRY